MSTTAIPPPRARRALPPLMQLTDGAAERLRGLYAAGEAGRVLRIGVKTKGCSGLSYDLSWVDGPQKGDETKFPRWFATYNKVLVTRETSAKAAKPGPAVLEGTLPNGA